MSEDKPHQFLDDRENETEAWLYKNFPNDLNLLNRQIVIITRYAEHLQLYMVSKYHEDLSFTIEELLSKDDPTVQEWASSMLIIHSIDNLQAARSNFLHGYLSVAISCLRNVAEAIRWFNATTYSAKTARDWLSGSTKPKIPKGLKLHPITKEMMKYYSWFSKFGSHPATSARAIAAARKTKYLEEISGVNSKIDFKMILRTINLFCGNFLTILDNTFISARKIDPTLSEELDNVKQILNTIFPKG